MRIDGDPAPLLASLRPLMAQLDRSGLRRQRRASGSPRVEHVRPAEAVRAGARHLCASWPSAWRRSAFTASWRLRWCSGRARSASAWRSARGAGRCRRSSSATARSSPARAWRSASAARCGRRVLFEGLLFGITPLDRTTYAAVAAAFAAIAMLAAVIPARRASAVDPVSALRAE